MMWHNILLEWCQRQFDRLPEWAMDVLAWVVVTTVIVAGVFILVSFVRWDLSWMTWQWVRATYLAAVVLSLWANNWRFRV